MIAAVLTSATAAESDGPAISPPSPSGHGYLIVDHKEVKACLTAQGRVMLVNHLRYCTKPFTEARREELKD